MLGKTNFVALLGGALALASYFGVEAQCTGGIDGIMDTSSDICCVAECEQCGGTGCASYNNTEGASDCCTSTIRMSGVSCDDSGAAPCIITESLVTASNDSVCNNGQTGVQDPNTDVCCPLECGDNCGGDGCGSIPGTTSSDCCSSEIIASGDICSDTVDPPCVISAVTNDTESNSTCSNGLTGYEDTVNGVCCDVACGLCGGVGCGDIAGLSAADCCSSTILASGESCEVTGEAPCTIDPPAVTPSTCPNGLAGVADGTVCCAEACGQCGGEGCGSIAGTDGATDCCSSTILTTGVYCDDGVSAPCIMVNGTYTNAPTVSPALGGTASPTAGSRGGLYSMAPTPQGQTMGPTDAFVTRTPTAAPIMMEGQTAAPSMAPTAGSRGGLFTGVPTAAPTTLEEALQTAAPTTGSRGGIPTSSPTSSTGAPTFLPEGVTIAPDQTVQPVDPANAATITSSGGVVTLAALAAGAFAVYAAARN